MIHADLAEFIMLQHSYLYRYMQNLYNISSQLSWWPEILYQTETLLIWGLFY